MANVVKVVEVMSESAKSWEDAVINAVTRTAQTVHGIKSVYVDNFTAKVEGDRIVSYRVDAKISFVLDAGERTIRGESQESEASEIAEAEAMFVG